MLNKDLELGLSAAISDAILARHEFITLEYLLLILVENKTIQKLLVGFEIDIETLKRDINLYIDNNIPKISGSEDYEPRPTLGFHRTLQRAAFHAQSEEREEVNAELLIIALLSEPESYSCYYLKRFGLNRLDVISFFAFGNIPRENDDFMEDWERDDWNVDELTNDELNEEAENALSFYLTNLNEKAQDKKIDPLIGRKEEIERVIQTLCRRRKNNPLLVGEAGVGKTAIAEGLAHKLINNDVPNVLSGYTVYSLDLGALLAGTKYRGDFEKRLKKVLAKIDSEPKSILFIDEIHSVVGAGATSNGTMDVANLIKPKLANGELRCMGATTYKEFQNVFKKDHSLTRRFQKIDIIEPSVEDTISILEGLQSRFEQHHEVKYSKLALRTAVELSNKHITDRRLPDKAIDVIDESGAYNQLLSKDNRLKEIGKTQVEKIVAKIARIPERQVSSSDRDVLKNLENNLKLVVFGQDKAIEQLATSIKLSRSGLGLDDKPIGSFLFAGPTGVGKTEVSKQLALQLGVELLRFDMSEYMERHSVSRLIGAPPGYVGHDQGGLLTDEVNKNPHAVLLLDEIEKAHPDLFNLLLQVMDNGTLTDSNGNKIDFRNVILIMTTNAGASAISRNSIGFSKQDNSGDSMDSIKKLFTPEFRNRLDDIVHFSNLQMNHIANVVDKFITELQAQLDSKQIEISVDSKARKWLAEFGYEDNMGARPMRRLIQSQIRKPLANEILFGDLQKGGKAKISIKEGKITISTIAMSSLKKSKILLDN